jgi:hypothetical protein
MLAVKNSMKRLVASSPRQRPMMEVAPESVAFAGRLAFRTLSIPGKAIGGKAGARGMINI